MIEDMYPKATPEDIEEVRRQLSATACDGSVYVQRHTVDLNEWRNGTGFPTQDALVTPRKEDILEDKQT